MRLLFLADGRSPIAISWIRHFVEQGHQVHLVSLFPCDPPLNLASKTVIPIPFTELGEGEGGVEVSPSWWRGFARRLATARVRTMLRHWLIPPAIPKRIPIFLDLIDKVKPELVHAMRIPYEGMLAASALKDTNIPLIVSIWGNDFTLHASSTPAMVRYTRNALKRAQALHTDCQRDLTLAYRWGFVEQKPAVILPGGGGIRPDVFYPPAVEASRTTQPMLINARGLRAYVRNDTVFKAFALVNRQNPKVRLVCPAMAGTQAGVALLKRYGGGSAALLPRLSQMELADLYRKSLVALSITEHDGTPNTLLEAMACGCLPIAGEIDSIKEWVDDGENGLLVPPGDAQSLAKAIIRALDDAKLRRRAKAINLDTIANRADYPKVMHRAEQFYQLVI